MIGKNTIKLIKSLALKKYRTKENLFLVEGDKLVTEVIYSKLFIKELIITSHYSDIDKIDDIKAEKITRTENKELRKASLLQNPQNSMAICRIPKKPVVPTKLTKFSIYLDGIQDPGNLGTIIRVCDWYGIEDIFASPDSVDLYNPKVIQASMGSFNRVRFYESSFEMINKIANANNTTVYGAFMNGNNIYSENLAKNALLVVGNEGKGIRSQMEALVDKKICIPNFSENTNKAESLNVSVATAIICSEFKRTP